MHQYDIRAADGRCVRVEAGNWLAAFGKGIELLGTELPTTGRWDCVIEPERVTMHDEVTRDRWQAEAVRDQIDVVAVGPSEILSSLLPDESDIPESDMPPPLIRMPTSLLAPPVEPLFSEQDLAEHVFDLSQALIGLPPDEACRAALGLVVELVAVRAATVMRGTVADEGLTVVGGLGSGENLIGTVRPFGSGLAGLAHDLAMPVKLDDEKDRRHLQRYDADYGERAEAMMCVPVLRDGAAYGVIELVNPINPFSDVDVDAVSAIATTLATALEHALY